MKIVLSQSQLNLDKCVGCKTCTHVCPTMAYKPTLSRPVEKKQISPCSDRCPAGNDIEGFLALTAQRRYLEAYRLLLETNPFPGTTGRVCHRPCEAGCNRASIDESVSIQALERFVADHAMGKGYRPAKTKVSRKPTVAVVGAGPAGLSCAYHLGRRGYRVTVFEGAAKPGGLLRYGIPEYRLPDNVLDWEIGNLAAWNIKIRANHRLGKNLKFGDLKRFDALFIAIGLEKSHRLMIPGEDGPGVLSALDFLRAVNAGRKVTLGARVAVIGGGNSAVDAARCALRLGARPVIVYRRSIEEMPAISSERRELAREGIEIIPFAMPIALVSAGRRVRQVECLRTRPGEAGNDGRQIPVPVEGSQFSLEVDQVIVAVGEAPDFAGLGRSLKTKVDRLEADAEGATPRKRVFAGGDAATRAGKVSDAIGSGRRAAQAVIRFLEKEPGAEAPVDPAVVRVEDLNPDYFNEAPRLIATHLDPAQAVRSFAEVVNGTPEPRALEEAQRCLGCAAPPTYRPEDCRGCVNCADRCPTGAITIVAREESLTVGVDPGRFDPEEILATCRRVNVHPKQIICYCTNTTAGEIVAAILSGAKTPEAISLMTGARTGCTVLCMQSIIKLLEASGLPARSSPTHQCYGKTFTVWDVAPGLKQRHEARGYHFDDDIRLIEKVFEKK